MKWTGPGKRQEEHSLEFIRVPDLSVGLYVLEAGAEDRQQPHREDEIYYVLEGKGIISTGEETVPVVPGSVVYVKAQVEHRFHSIQEKLKSWLCLLRLLEAVRSRASESGQNKESSRETPGRIGYPPLC